VQRADRIVVLMAGASWRKKRTKIFSPKVEYAELLACSSA
jgi:hypothetical protein